MKELGIDISAWQGEYNLTLAKKQGAKFVILKAGGADDGYYKDSKFERNYKLAKELGLKVGAYFFSKALSEADAKKESEYLRNILKGKTFELPIYLDVENKTQLKIGKKTLTAVILTWLKDMRTSGYYPGVYSSAAYFGSYIDDKQLDGWPHWVAQWSKTQPKGVGLWQFGGETNYIRSTTFAGQTTDQNYLLIDYTTTIKKLGLNGFKKAATVSTCTLQMRVVRYGDKHAHVATLQRNLRALGYTRSDDKTLLGVDGIFGKHTEYAVRKFQTDTGIGADGIAGIKTWSKLLYGA